jgi:uncharacterized membrane protein YphA (DoxX/SURF4 family)
MRGSVGQAIFASAIAGLGMLSLVTGHFASVWQPVPPTLPGREALAYGNGVLMCALGIGLAVPRTTARAALILMLYLIAWLVLLHLPIVLRAPAIEDRWAGLGENSTLIIGALVLFASRAGDASPRLRGLSGQSGIRVARVIFVLALPLMSLDELLYAHATASYIPQWIPAHLLLAWLTGMAQMATAVAVGLGLLARLATLLQAAMFATFTLLVWVTRLVHAPTRFNCTALLVSSALTGGAWLLAETYRGSPWLQLTLRSRAQRKLRSVEARGD